MRVLDLSHVMAGPVCGLMLADMGADVIKVENTEIGDTSRQMRTPSIEGQSAAFMMMNRNKRGLAVDLKRPQGQEVLKRLVRDADVLIENYRQGTMREAGRRLRRARQGSIPASSIARSRASAAPALSPARAASTSSRRPCRASCRSPARAPAGHR